MQKALCAADLAGITSLGSIYLSLTTAAVKGTLMLVGLFNDPAIGGAYGGVLLTVMVWDVVVKADLTVLHDLTTLARRLVALTLSDTCAEHFLVDLASRPRFGPPDRTAVRRRSRH